MQATRKSMILLVICSLILTMVPAAAFAEEETTGTVVSTVDLDITKKKVFVCFNDEIADGSLDKSKVTLKSNRAVVAATAYSLSKVDEFCFAITATTALKAPTTLQLAAGVIRDKQNVPSQAFSEDTLSVAKFPAIRDVRISPHNREVMIRFVLKPGETIIRSWPYMMLDDFVEVAVDGKTFKKLDSEGAPSGMVNVEYSNVTIEFSEPLTNPATKIRLLPDLLSYKVANEAVTGNANGAIVTNAVDLVPYILNSSLSPDNKQITVTFSEKVMNASTLTDAIAAANELKSKVKLVIGGIGGTVVDPATVAIANGKITATFTNALTGTGNQLEFESDSLQDAKKNKIPTLLTNFIWADGSAPEVLAVGYASKDKTLTVYFNENIILNGATTPISLASALRYNDSSAFTSPTVSLSKNTMIIKHKTAAITSTGNGGINNLVIPEAVLRDAAGNVNQQLTTSAADVNAPQISSYRMDFGIKELFVTFDEPIVATNKTIPLASITVTTGTGTNAVSKPLSDVIWKTASTAVTIVEGNVLRITNLKKALAAGDKISIKKDTLMDLALNKNATAEVTVFVHPADAIVVLQVADGALSSITNILQTIRELAVQSQNPALTSDDRVAMQAEVNALLTEINRIANESTFNQIVLIGATPYTLRVRGESLITPQATFTFSAATTTALGVAGLNFLQTSLQLITTVDSALEQVTSARTAINELAAELETQLP
jgi:hypothetical protein